MSGHSGVTLIFMVENPAEEDESLAQFRNSLRLSSLLRPRNGR